MRVIYKKISLFVKKNWGLLLVISIYLGIVVIMSPIRQVGFLDDFAYYHSVRNLAQLGFLKVDEWVGPSLLFQIYWGTLFVKLFGMSYKALQFSSVTIFFFGLIAFYQTLKELGIDTKRSVFFTLLMLSFPLLVQYIFSFMTVSPYIGVLLISLYFGVRAVKYDKMSDVFFTVVFSVFAYLTRQIGIAPSWTLLVIFLIKSFYKKKLYTKQLLICLLGSILPVFWYEHWVRIGSNMTSTQHLKVYISLSNFEKAVLALTNYPLLRLTNEAYQWTLYKMGYFSNFIFGILLLPLLATLTTRPKQILIIAKRNLKQAVLGLCVLALFYYLLYQYVLSGKFIAGVFTETPRIIFDYYLGWETWKKIWAVLVILSIIFYSFFIGKTLTILKDIFLKARSKFRLSIFIVGTIFGIVIFSAFFLRGFYLYRYDFVEGTFYSVFLLGMFIILLFIFSKFEIKTKAIINQSISVFLFLAIFTVLHLFLTSLGYYNWQEYILPLMPSYILLFALLLQKIKISPLLGIVVVLFSFYLTFSFTRSTYQKDGIYWELSELAIKKTGIDPRNAGVSNYAWIPYFFEDQAVEERVAQVGGNKYDIVDLKFWDTAKYGFGEQKIFVYYSNCKIAPIQDGQKVLFEKSEWSISGEKFYCVTIKK